MLESLSPKFWDPEADIATDAPLDIGTAPNFDGTPAVLGTMAAVTPVGFELMVLVLVGAASPLVIGVAIVKSWMLFSLKDCICGLKIKE